MANEALAWPSPPSLTDNVDGTQSYQMGLAFSVPSAQSCTGVQWRVPDTVAPPAGGVHAVGLFDDGSNTRLAYKEFTPVTGDYQNILFDTSVSLASDTTYTAVVYTLHYVFRASNPSGVSTPSGLATAIEGRLEGDNGGASTADTPNTTSTATFYVSPLIAAPDATPTIAPDSLSLSLALGAPTAAQSLHVAPNSLSLPVTVGAPAVAVALTVAPAGLSLPVSLGAPSVAAAFQGTAAPDSLTLPVSFGAPAVRFRPPETGNWESLLGVLHAAQGDAARDADRLAHPVDCPIHGWPLERARGQLFCLFGGHTL